MATVVGVTDPAARVMAATVVVMVPAAPDIVDTVGVTDPANPATAGIIRVMRARVAVMVTLCRTTTGACLITKAALQATAGVAALAGPASRAMAPAPVTASVVSSGATAGADPKDVAGGPITPEQDRGRNISASRGRSNRGNPDDNAWIQ